MEDFVIIESKKEAVSPFVEATGFPEETTGFPETNMSEEKRDFYRAWAIACTGLALICAYILMCFCGAGHHGILGFIFPC